MSHKHSNKGVTVRHAHIGDLDGLHALAVLDGAATPELPALVAESDAKLLAALPLGAGRPVADPFEPTADVVALLKLRAAQLEGSETRPRLRERLGLRRLRAA